MTHVYLIIHIVFHGNNNAVIIVTMEHNMDNQIHVSHFTLFSTNQQIIT